MPLTIRQRRQRVADYIQTHAASNDSDDCGRPPDCIPAAFIDIARDCPAVSSIPNRVGWETAVGYGWLVRLVIAVVYHFGIKHSVGAESLSAFSKAIHLERQVGCSPHHPAAAQTSGGGRDGRL